MAHAPQADIIDHDTGAAILKQVAVTRVRNGAASAASDLLAVEVPVALEYNGISHVVMLASPANLEDFALGFSLTEGILSHPSELYGVEVEARADGIAVQLDIASERFVKLKERRRNMTGRTGCGLCGTEALDPIAPQYVGDLIAWTAIGARTSESQTHREMSSGLSTPVGFKNATNGEVGVAVNAILSASRPHRFLGISGDGQVSIVHTTGNPYGHLVLRGGDGRPNYDTVSIALAEDGLKKAKLTPNIVVDCSHANSYKKPELQPLVMSDVVSQIVAGNRSVVGVMIESNIAAGNQPIQADRSKMTYGCSVTDGCVDWDTTATMIREAAERLRGVLV